MVAARVWVISLYKYAAYHLLHEKRLQTTRKNQFCWFDVSPTFYSIALKQRYAAGATFARACSAACYKHVALRMAEKSLHCCP